MSAEEVRKVLDHSRARGAARMLLVVLAEHTNGRRGDGVAWPSIGRLAEETGLSRRSVFRALAELEALGEITVVVRGGGRRGSNRYRLTLPRGDRTSPGDAVSSGVTSRHLGGDTASPRGVTSWHPEPEVEPEENPSPARVRARADEPPSAPLRPMGVAAGDSAEEVIDPEFERARARVRSMRESLVGAQPGTAKRPPKGGRATAVGRRAPALPDQEDDGAETPRERPAPCQTPRRENK
jgi:hypothetical protein